MLDFVYDNLAKPLYGLAHQKVISPLYNWAIGKTKEVATKAISTTLTKTAVKPLINTEADIDEHHEADAVHFADRVADTLQQLPKNAKYGLQGIALESGTSAALAAINYLNPTRSAKVLTYLAPRAMCIASVNRESPSVIKEVAIGAFSHTAGILAQDSADAMFPTAAPYGGYIAYGAASGAAAVGLDKAYNYFRTRV
jgi:hypothetical protein